MVRLDQAVTDLACGVSRGGVPDEYVQLGLVIRHDQR